MDPGPFWEPGMVIFVKVNDSFKVFNIFFVKLHPDYLRGLEHNFALIG